MRCYTPRYLPCKLICLACFSIFLSVLAHAQDENKLPYTATLLPNDTSVMIIPEINNTFGVHLRLKVVFDNEVHDSVQHKYNVLIKIVQNNTDVSLIEPAVLPQFYFPIYQDTNFKKGTEYLFDFVKPLTVSDAKKLLKDEYFTLNEGDASSGPYVIRFYPSPCCCEDDSPPVCTFPNHHGWIKPKDVIFDFKTMRMAFPKGSGDLKRSDAIRIRVINYNPFLYQVNINGTDSTAQAVVDNNNLLSAFTNLTNLSTIVGGLGGVGAGPGTSGDKYQNYTTTNPTGNKHKQPNPNETLDKQEDLIKVFDKYAGIIGGYSGDFRLLKQHINSGIYQWDTYFKAQRYMYPTCTDFAILANQGQEIEKEFEALQTQISDLYSTVAKGQIAYLREIGQYADMIYDKTYALQSSNKYQDSIVHTFFTGANNNINICDSLLSYKVLTIVHESIDRMKGITPTYLSPAIFLSGDSKVVTIGFSPWSDSLRLPTFPASTFELPWAQRTIWGVNAGIYTAAISNYNYALGPLPTDSTHSKFTRNGSPVEVGIDALAYFACKVNHNREDYNYIGGAFGAAMSISSAPKPRIIAGFTYVHGRTNRLVITLGPMVGYAQTLSKAYSLKDPPYQTSNPPVNYTVNLIKPGVFLSIGYSFIN